MCEYCGCQQIAAIADLTREHDQLVAQMSVARAHLGADRKDAAAAVCRDMLAVIRPHTRVEEEGLFPFLTGEFPDHVQALRADHLLIESVLGESRDGTPVDPAWPDRLLAAFHRLREHILKEQDGMFPAALIALDGDQWDQVEAVRVTATHQYPSPPQVRNPRPANEVGTA